MPTPRPPAAPRVVSHSCVAVSVAAAAAPTTPPRRPRRRTVKNRRK